MSGPIDDVMAVAEAAWNALPRVLRWTTEPPQEAGWYLWREKEWRRPIVREVEEGLVISDEFGTWSVIDVTGQWAGPIPEPEEQYD